MKSVTLEDVYYVHERNILFYHDCIKNKRYSTCPTKNIGLCLCKENCPIYPNKICNEYTISQKQCKKEKIYIRFGEECPICFEPIYFRNSAFLTPCGHAFHKKCLHNAHTTRLLICDNSSEDKLYCPMCRHDVPTELFYNPMKYNINKLPIEKINGKKNCDFIKNTNFCLVADNLFENIDLCSPELCFRNKKKHYLGMDKTCKVCLNFHKGIKLILPNMLLVDSYSYLYDSNSESSSDSESDSEEFWTDSDEENEDNTILPMYDEIE